MNGIVTMFGLGFYIGVILLFLFLIRKIPFIKKIKENKYYIFSGIFTLFMVWLPFWDMTIQKFYQIYFKMNSDKNMVIYEYPEKNENGKYEGVYIPEKNIYLSFKEEKFEFIEEKKKKKYIRYKNGYFSKNNELKIIENIKSRYEIKVEEIEKEYYNQYNIFYIDDKTKKILGKNINYTFPVKKEKEKIRYWLFWIKHHHGGIVQIKGIYNEDSIFEKLFK